MRKIKYGRQDVNQEDIDAVVSILKSDWLTQGPVTPIFEKLIADYCGSKYSVATNSATSALHIACLALGVGRGDNVWVSANTFVASANCARYCGANVDFVDIDPKTYNLSVDCLSDKLIIAEKLGTLPKVVIAVHLCGQSCDMIGIHALAKKYSFSVIEDASHAVGGRYNGKPIGCCIYSDITVFSFHPVKIITSGEGGMALTNNDELANRLKMFRSHGMAVSQEYRSPTPSDEMWNYQQVELGFNYRMTDIHAALGISQMKRLDQFVTKRHSIARKYDSSFGNISLKIPWQSEESYSSYHLYVIRVKNDGGINQEQLYHMLQKAGINVNLHYPPVYLHPYYHNLGFRRGHCPEAERYHKEALSIPMYPTLSTNDQNRVIKLITEIMC